MAGVIQFFVNNKVEVITALFFLSELLAFLPGVKSSSVFQAIANGLKALYEKVINKPALPPAA